MKLKKKHLTKTLRFLRKNYFLTIFGIVVIFVGITILFKYVNSKPTYYYAKIQVNYPASYYSKPDFWLIKSLRADEKQYNAFGNTEAEILEERYYPSSDNTSFNIYLTVKLAGNVNKKTHEYTFQRTKIGIGSPITLNLSSSQLYGTVVDLSQTPFKDKYIEKIITLVNRGAYFKDSPYIYEGIQIGDRYFDGQDYVFQIIDKSLQKNIVTITNNTTGQVLEGETDATQNIVVKAKILVLQKDDQLIFAGDQPLRVGSKFAFSSSDFDFNFLGFLVNQIQ